MNSTCSPVLARRRSFEGAGARCSAALLAAALAVGPALAQQQLDQIMQVQAGAAKALEGVDWDSATVVEVDLADHQYTPHRMTMKLGKPHILRLKNIGVVPHDMVGGSFFNAAVVRMTQTRVGRTVTPVLKSVYVRPKQEMEIWLVPTQVGVHSFYCGIAGHRDAGMEGEIEIVR